MEANHNQRNRERWPLIILGVFLTLVAVVVTLGIVFRPVGYYPLYPFGFGWIFIPFGFFFLFFIFGRMFLAVGVGFQRRLLGERRVLFHPPGEVCSRRDYKRTVRANEA